MEAEAAKPLALVTPAIQPSNVPALFDFMPRSLEQALELAKVLSDSTMVPKDYIGKPGNVLVAIQMGAELGLKPLQSMQSLAVINGKPGVYGDAGKALLIANGCTIIEQDIREIEAQGYAMCTIKRPGKPDVTRTYGIDDAKRARLWGKDSPWSTAPFRQLAWRAFWFAARDQAPDILKGMRGAEELVDIPKDVTPESVETTGSETASRASQIARKLRKVDVGDVVKAFDDSKTAEEIADAVDLAAKHLKAADDREKANAAFHRAKARLVALNETEKKPDAPLNWQDVVAAIEAANTEEALNAAGDLIRSLPEGKERDSAQALFELMMSLPKMSDAQLAELIAAGRALARDAKETPDAP